MQTLLCFHFVCADKHNHTLIDQEPLNCQYKLIKGYEANVYVAFSLYKGCGNILINQSFIEVTLGQVHFI